MKTDFIEKKYYNRGRETPECNWAQFRIQPEQGGIYSQEASGLGGGTLVNGKLLRRDLKSGGILVDLTQEKSC